MTSSCIFKFCSDSTSDRSVSAPPRKRVNNGFGDASARRRGRRTDAVMASKPCPHSFVSNNMRLPRPLPQPSASPATWQASLSPQSRPSPFVAHCIEAIIVPENGEICNPSASLGFPVSSIMFSSWLIVDEPGKIGLPTNTSPRMQPKPQMSTPNPRCRPRNSSCSLPACGIQPPKLMLQTGV